MKKQRYKHSLILIVLIIFIAGLPACKQKYTPKSSGYFRIDLPKHEYQTLDSFFPYGFEYSKIAKIKKDKDDPSRKLWININYPKYNGTIHLSYIAVNNNLAQLLEDARKLAYKHTIKAESIEEQQFTNSQNKVYGILYHIKGNTASSVQFVATDSSSHFLRGALYFMNHPNQDSLAPVIKYIDHDIKHIMETLTWK